MHSEPQSKSLSNPSASANPNYYDSAQNIQHSVESTLLTGNYIKFICD